MALAQLLNVIGGKITKDSFISKWSDPGRESDHLLVLGIETILILTFKDKK